MAQGVLVVTPEQQFPPGYLEEFATGYDHGSVDARYKCPQAEQSIAGRGQDFSVPGSDRGYAAS